jgi:hypothetical protein
MGDVPRRDPSGRTKHRMKQVPHYQPVPQMAIVPELFFGFGCTCFGSSDSLMGKITRRLGLTRCIGPEVEALHALDDAKSLCNFNVAIGDLADERRGNGSARQPRHLRIPGGCVPAFTIFSEQAVPRRAPATWAWLCRLIRLSPGEGL